MIDLPVNYAKVLFEMDFGAEHVEAARRLLTESKELREALTNPLVRKSEKRSVIEKLFPQPMWNFFKVMSDNGDIDCAEEMFAAYDSLELAKRDTIRGVLTYVTKPDDAQIKRLKKKIAKDYNKGNVVLELVEDPSLIGGFVLTIGDSVLDQSVKTSMKKLKRHFTER